MRAAGSAEQAPAGPGDDVDVASRAHAFLSRLPGGDRLVEVADVGRVPVGRSRENWVFDAVWADGGREPLLVRRDPLGGLLETDRAREFAVLRALESSPVPAPIARGLDPDGAAFGRPSLVMRREPGVCDYFVLNGDRPLGERARLAARFCELVALVHAVDWRALGMGSFLDDPGPWASRAALDEWEAVLRRDQLEPYPELELALGWLRRTAPRSVGTVLVHGDIKPGNALLDGTRIVALLDWELAHLGDPMEDLGWVTQPLRTDEHLIAGTWERADLLAHYQRASGREVDEASVAWWNVFATFKTAVMQVSGLRAFVEGRCLEPYRPTAKVLGTLLDAVEG